MNIIKAIINDFKTDIQFLGRVTKDDYKFPYTLKQMLDIRPMLKDAQTWIFFMILIAAVLTGMFVSAKYYQRMANVEIIEAQHFVDAHCTINSSYFTIVPEADFSEIIEGMDIGAST